MDTIETKIYYAVLITALVLGSVIVIFFITMIRAHRKHTLIMRNQLLEEVRILEQERNRIACDLHDELGPLLAITKMQINAVCGDRNEDHLYIGKANENIEILMERFEGVAKNLTPRLLATKGLNVALSNFIDQYEETVNVRFIYRYNVPSQVPATISLHLYRLILEIIHNAVKHSGAKEIKVELKERKRKLYVLCADNGRGIRLSPAPMHKNGLGLRSLENRAMMLGGNLRRSEVKNGGTEYFIVLPLQNFYEKDQSNPGR